MPTPTIEEILIIAEVEGVTAARKDLDELTESTAKADKEGKKYEKTLGDMAKETTVFGVSLNGLSGGLKSSLSAVKASTTGLKAFRIALASTGIGLLVIALASAFAWLKTTSAGVEFLADAFSAIGVVVDKFTESLVKVFEGLVAIAQGNFSEGLTKIATSFDGIGESISRAVTEAVNLNAAIRALELRTATNSVALAQYNKHLAENKRLSEDVTLSLEERVEANLKAQETLENISRVEQELATQATANALKALTEAADGTEAKREALIAYSAIAAQQIDIETASIERSIELQNKGNDLAKQYAEEQIARQEVRAKQFTEVDAAEAKGIEIITEKQIDANLEKLGSDIAFYKVKSRLRAEDQEEEQRVQEATVQLFKTTLNAIGTALGKSAAAAKALAIFNATLDAGLAIGKAIASAPWPANIPALGVAIAAGANLIATIRQAAEPNIPSYGKGGLINGPSHTNGGMMANLEGGETVINAKSSKMFRKELSAMNVAGGGIPFMQLGGVIPQTVGATPFRDLELIAMQNRTVLVTEDLQAVQRRTLVTEVLTTL